jgi:hypothetical protein
VGVEDWVCCTILSGSRFSFAACFGLLVWRTQVVCRADLRDRRFRGGRMRIFIVSVQICHWFGAMVHDFVGLNYVIAGELLTQVRVTIRRFCYKQRIRLQRTGEILIQTLGINLFAANLFLRLPSLPKPQPKNAMLKLLVHAKTIESLPVPVLTVSVHASRAKIKSPKQIGLELTKS